MSLLPQSIADLVARDHLPRQAVAGDGSRHVLYWDAPHVRSMLASDWPAPLPTDPTPAEIASAIAAQAAAQQLAQADAAQLRQQILTLAQSAVGLRVDALTAGQVRALFALVLWQKGALKPDMTVRPLVDWADRREP